MELLETDDPIKGQLLQRSAKHREQLGEDARLISEQTEKMLTNALIIGGALAVTYFVVSSFSGSKKKKKSKTAQIRLVHGGAAEEQAQSTAEPEAPGMMTQIGTALAAQATAFMLSLAKEKLMEFLESQAAKKQTTNDPAKHL
jgi:hypothetical protein